MALPTTVRNAMVSAQQAQGVNLEAINTNTTLLLTASNDVYSTPHVSQPTGSGAAINASATATAAQIATGLITSTSAAAVALVLPTATLLAAQLGAVRGTYFDFIVDNSVGASTITITTGSGMPVTTAVITGGATLTVLATAVGIFRAVFTSTTAGILYRIG